MTGLPVLTLKDIPARGRTSYGSPDIATHVVSLIGIGQSHAHRQYFVSPQKCVDISRSKCSGGLTANVIALDSTGFQLSTGLHCTGLQLSLESRKEIHCRAVKSDFWGADFFLSILWLKYTVAGGAPMLPLDCYFFPALIHCFGYCFATWSPEQLLVLSCLLLSR